MKRLVFLTVAVGALTTGCATVSRADTASLNYSDPNEAGAATGVGIESQDISAMVDRMARDILSTPQIANAAKPPYVIVDDAYFENQGTTPINKRMITERLMIDLNRAAAGRMYFVEAQAEAMVVRERERKRDGEVGSGSLSKVQRIAGADYRLTGAIMDQNVVNPRTGVTTRSHTITFKLVDLEAGLTVWSNYYDMKKNASTDVLYR